MTNPPAAGEGRAASDEPGDDWLPFHEAKAYYAPRFLGRFEDWHAAVAAIVRKELSFEGGIDWKIDEWLDDAETLTLKVQELEFEFSTYNGGSYYISHFNCPSELLLKGDPPRGDATTFASQMKVATFKPEHIKAADLINGLARRLALTFDQLDSAIKWGNARVMARKQTALGPFAQILPDQWRFDFPPARMTLRFRKRATSCFPS